MKTKAVAFNLDCIFCEERREVSFTLCGTAVIMSYQLFDELRVRPHAMFEYVLHHGFRLGKKFANT